MYKEYLTKFIIHSQETRNVREIPQGLQPARFLCPWGFSRQRYWSGLPCPPSNDLPHPGIKPRSPTLQVDSFLSEPPGQAQYDKRCIQNPFFLNLGMRQKIFAFTISIQHCTGCPSQYNKAFKNKGMGLEKLSIQLLITRKQMVSRQVKCP